MLACKQPVIALDSYVIPGLTRNLDDCSAAAMTLVRRFLDALGRVGKVSAFRNPLADGFDRAGGKNLFLVLLLEPLVVGE